MPIASVRAIPQCFSLVDFLNYNPLSLPNIESWSDTESILVLWGGSSNSPAIFSPKAQPGFQIGQVSCMWRKGSLLYLWCICSNSHLVAEDLPWIRTGSKPVLFGISCSPRSASINACQCICPIFEGVSTTADCVGRPRSDSSLSWDNRCGPDVSVLSISGSLLV